MHHQGSALHIRWIRADHTPGSPTNGPNWTTTRQYGPNAMDFSVIGIRDSILCAA
jgi:hypothetical protein